jgi:proteasome assembly chaperone (PAC2) family protein
LLKKVLKNTAGTADYMLVCLPGIGLVGSLTGELFIESASENFSLLELYPESLLYVSAASKEGLISPPKITVNKIHIRELGNLMIVRGSSQPTTQINQYELAEKLVEVAENSGVKLVIGIGGYAVTQVGEKRKTYLSSSDWRVSIIGASVGFLPLRGTVVGAAGLVPGLASLHGLSSACILVETGGESPDLIAAKTAYNNITAFLKKYFTEPM